MEKILPPNIKEKILPDVNGEPVLTTEINKPIGGNETTKGAKSDAPRRELDVDTDASR